MTPKLRLKSKTVEFLHASQLNGNWQDIEPQASKGASPEEQREAGKSAEAARRQLNEFLQSILSTPNLIVLAGSGSSLGKAGGPSMKDLWEGARKLPGFEEVVATVKHRSGNEWIEDLLSRCRRAQDFIEGSKGKQLTDFLSESEKMICKACSEFLPRANLAGHHTFLRRMARRRHRAPRLKLFTTNYDLCFEKAAGELGIILIDGFSFSQPRRFDPRFFNYDVVRRAKTADESNDFVEGVVQIFKLHGSVDWDDTEQGIIQTASPEKPCLIYPTSMKYEKSYSQPHLELMSQFQTALREPNTCLVTIGFGFNDNHLSAPIMAAVNSNPSFKLLVVDPAAKSKSGAGAGYLSELRDKISTGEPDIMLLNAGFDRFSELIPHLRALSPAERIEQSVREIAGRG